MNRSPIQLMQLQFKKISVELDADHAPHVPRDAISNSFMFEGVMLHTTIGVGKSELLSETGILYNVSVRLIVLNEISENDSECYSPYKLDVEADSLVLVLKGTEGLGTPENLAAVNGASLVWSALREQILTLTSRMPAGPVTLPTVHFRDLIKPDTASQ